MKVPQLQASRPLQAYRQAREAEEKALQAAQDIQDKCAKELLEDALKELPGFKLVDNGAGVLQYRYQLLSRRIPDHRCSRHSTGVDIAVSFWDRGVNYEITGVACGRGATLEEAIQRYAAAFQRERMSTKRRLEYIQKEYQTCEDVGSILGAIPLFVATLENAEDGGEDEDFDEETYEEDEEGDYEEEKFDVISEEDGAP